MELDTRIGLVLKIPTIRVNLIQDEYNEGENTLTFPIFTIVGPPGECFHRGVECTRHHNSDRESFNSKRLMEAEETIKEFGWYYDQD